MAAQPRNAWAGWIVFAGTMMIVIGAFNMLEGIIGLIWDERVIMTTTDLVVVDLTGWAWTILIFGALMLGVGIALLAARAWARIVAIILVAVHFVAEVGWLGAYPVWSLLMIGLDTVVLVALTFRWADARSSLRPEEVRDVAEPVDTASPSGVRVSPAS